MAGLIEGALVGAAVSAVLTEVIVLAKKAWRCRNDCEKLATTVGFAKPHVEAFEDQGNEKCQKWLRELKGLLDEAKDIMEKYCVLNSKRWMVSQAFQVLYKKKSTLSFKVLDINDRIKLKVADVSMLIHGTTMEVYGLVKDESKKTTVILQKMDEIKNDRIGEVGSSKCYIPCVLPSNIVSFKNDPFQELKASIISKYEHENPPMALGLIGCGGAGKTLFAKMLHNDDDIKAKYGKEAILWVTVGRDANLSQIYEKMGKFLSTSIDSGTLDEQFTFMMDAFQKRRVLLILDDVWDQRIGEKSLMEWLDVAKGEGSVTLVTTRSGDVLRIARVKQTISIPLLSPEKSWELFCSHAFGSDVPSTHEIGEVAKQVCEECGGLPLALEVIGASMYGKGDVLRWKHALGRLSNLQGKDKVLEKLKHSYEEVEKEEQKLFLYFAAFPEDCEIPTRMLCSIWHVEQSNMIHGGVESVYLEGMAKLFTLADRSLIKLSEDAEIATIHDILRELAMDIIHKMDASEYYFHPGKALRGLPSPIPKNMKRMSLIESSLCDSLDDFNQRDVEVLLLSGLHVEATKGGRRQIDATSKFLLKNSKLRYLDFSSSTLQEFPKGIGKLRALMYLDLSGCDMKKLPKDIVKLEALISLNLSGCVDLEKLPEGMGKMKALTSLDLSGCRALQKLPEGMGNMKALTSLDLHRCYSLEKLPEDIVEFEALISLNLSGCGALEKLPEGMGKMKALTSLDLHWCYSLEKLPEDIVELEALISLNLSGCGALEKLPEGMGKMKALTSLDLSGCRALQKLPKGMGNMKALTSLDLHRCYALEKLPEDIVEFEALISLNLSGCGALEKLPEGMGKMKALTSLDLHRCYSLEKLPEDIVELEALISLNLSGCGALEKLFEGMGKMKALTSLDLHGCYSLEKLPEDIVELEAFISLVLSGCRALQKLPEGMGNMKALTSLDVCNCVSVLKLPEDIVELEALTSLDLSGCGALEKLPEGMGKMKALTSLGLSGCYSLEKLPEDIVELEALISLDLSGCRALQKLPEGMGKMKALTSLDVCNCVSLLKLPEDIVELEALTSLDLSGCEGLEKLPEGMGKMKALTSLNLSFCKALEKGLEDIVDLEALSSSVLLECLSLEKL